MRSVFLDTVGLIGLWDEDDPWHVAASEAFAALNRERVQLTTTSFILLECGNAAARTPYRLAVDRLRKTLLDNQQLIVPTDADWNDAWRAYCQADGAAAGIVDQVSFAVMRRAGITEVFSNDYHFRAAGFTTLF